MKWYNFIVLSILLCITHEAKSTHILGGHVSYECLGGDEYEFTLTVYSDCFGQQTNPVPDNLIFFTPDASCPGLNTSANLALLSTTQEISELCDEELLDSSCLPGGFSPGTIMTTYTVNQILDPSCTWTASWSFDDYNFFVNTDFPVFDDAYFSATVDPLMGCNSTIDIDGTQQVPYGLVGQPFSHQIEYTNTPGNTVNFSIGIPQIENNQLNFDIPGFDPSGITVSPSGLVEFTPPTAGNYVTNIIIEEFDSMGNLLYTMTETMTFVSRLFIPGEPEFTDGGGIENNGGTFISPNSYEVCEGDSICITFEAIHPDPFSVMEITSNISTLFPDATIDSIACPTIVPGVNAICSEVCWRAQPTPNIEFSMYVIDNDCDLPVGDTINVQLNLTSGTTLTLLNTDSTICEGTPVDFDIMTSGVPDFIFEYSSEVIGSGVIDTLTIDPLGLTPVTLNPIDETEYCVVSLTDSEGCEAAIDLSTSCFTVELNPELSVVGFGNDTTICVGEDVIVDLGLAGTAPFTVDYTITDLESGITSAEQTEILALGETWTLSPITSSIFSITNITDGSPISPCILLMPDEVTITVNEFTSASVTTDSIACLGDLVPVNFVFENFIGPNFDVTYTTQAGTDPAVSATITDIPLGELTPDSLYSFIGIPGGIIDNTTFEITDIIDDGNECITIDNNLTTVLLASQVELTFSNDGTICSGDSLLTTMSVTGDGPWNISINTPNSITNEEIEINVSPFNYYIQDEGSYIITSVQDKYECDGSIVGEVELTLTDLPLLNINGESNLCSGASTEVPINIISPSPLYFEVLDPNNALIQDSVGFFLGDSTFTATIPGIYTLQTVTNADGCINDTITSFYTVIEVATPNATLTGNNFICTDDSTQVFISITDGTAPFNYDLGEINSGTITPFLNANNLDSAFVLISGEYSLINFTDSNNCSGILNANLIVTDEILPLVDAGPDFNACANSEVTLGTTDDPLLEYQWTSNNSAVLDTLTGAFPPVINVVNTGLVDIIFEVYLEVNNGMCFNNDTLLITVNPEPLSDAGDDFTVCFDEPASLDGMGVGNLTWLDNGNLDDYNIATPNVLNTLITDTFVVQIEDLVNLGCFGLDTVIVTVNPEIVLDLDFSAEICSGTCDGEIISSSSGGSAPFIELWNDSNGDPISSLNLTNLCADSYTITVTDDFGCVRDSTITITELPEYFISDVLITNPVCFGDETGIIEVIAVNTDSITVNSALQVLDPVFNMNGANDYTIVATNNIGCEADTIVTLTSNPELFLSTNFAIADICDGDNISFEATATGGINDYTYYWIPSTDDFNTNESIVSLSPSNDVSVQVYATDDNDQCFTDTLTMEAVFPPIIEVQVNDDITICQGEQIVLESIVSGGNGNLSCLWDVPETGIINNCITTVSPLVNTTYEVTVADGCSVPVIASFVATVNITPIPNFTVDTLNGCYPVTVEFSNTTDTDLLGNCEWNFGDGSAPLPICTDVTYTYVNPGNFNASLSVTSEEGCTGVSANNPTIIVYDYPTADFEWTPNPVNILEPEVQFINLTQGGTNYVWDAEGAFTATGANPYFEFEPTSLDSYNICLQAENQFGCADTICKFLIVEGVVVVNVPNAFSPDGDNLNEVFRPIAVGISNENYLFQIWSREGELIFETTQRGVPWDGSVESGNYYSGNAVYTWTLQVQDAMTADIITYRGHVTLIR